MEEVKSIKSLSNQLLSFIFEYFDLPQITIFSKISRQFYEATKYRFISYFYSQKWDRFLIDENDPNPYKLFLKIVNMNYLLIPPSQKSSKSNQASNIHALKKIGIKKLQTAHGFYSSKFQYCIIILTYSGELHAYSFDLEKGCDWKPIDIYKDSIVKDVASSKYICFINENKATFDLIPSNENQKIFKLIEIKDINEEARLIASSQSAHICCSKTNALYFWKLDDHLVRKNTCLDSFIEEISCELFRAYIRCENHKIYIVELQNNIGDIVYSIELSQLNLYKIFSGPLHSFGYSYTQVPPLEEWDNNSILIWLDENCLFDFKNIVRNQMIDGKVLNSIDKTYLEEKWGIEEEALKDKILTLIKKQKKHQIKNEKLYAWGNNLKCQLGTQSNSSTYKFPVKITLPYKDEDRIMSLYCGIASSILITSHGKLFMTKEREEHEPVKESKPKNQNKVKNKKKQSEIKNEEKEKLWFLLEENTPKNFQRAFLFANTYLCEYLSFLKLKKSKKEAPNFKDAKQIMNKILWDPNINKEEFSVVYEDRFQGLIETPYDDFIKREDIPLHRIYIFKQKGEVVWDRKNRFSKL